MSQVLDLQEEKSQVNSLVCFSFPGQLVENLADSKVFTSIFGQNLEDNK